MNLFRCRHPFAYLVVEKEQTVEKVDEDFESVTYYLYCLKCNIVLTLNHAKLRDGVEAFLKRGGLKKPPQREDGDENLWV